MERKENCSSENALYYARILFVWFCLLGQVGHVVAKRLKVEVETPGTLPELVGKKAKYKVTDLTLKGTLNGRDLCFLREMAGRDKERQSTPGRLRVLDMRYVSFARGGGGYVRHGEWREVQGEHTLPPYLFSECGLTHIDLPERLDTIAEGLKSVKGVSGRMESLPAEGFDFSVILDFAHTPDGLSNLLSAVQGFAKGRVIAVFGCGGDRDNAKRPIMGATAAKLADFCVVTSDNPRTEDPTRIINMVLEGVRSEKTEYVVIENRREAIRYALNIAKKDDVVVLAGKGHENYQEINGIKHPFDEKIIVAEILEDMRCGRK